MMIGKIVASAAVLVTVFGGIVYLLASYEPSGNGHGSRPMPLNANTRLSDANSHVPYGPWDIGLRYTYTWDHEVMGCNEPVDADGFILPFTPLLPDGTRQNSYWDIFPTTDDGPTAVIYNVPGEEFIEEGQSMPMRNVHLAQAPESINNGKWPIVYFDLPLTGSAIGSKTEMFKDASYGAYVTGLLTSSCDFTFASDGEEFQAGSVARKIITQARANAFQLKMEQLKNDAFVASKIDFTRVYYVTKSISGISRLCMSKTDGCNSLGYNVTFVDNAANIVFSRESDPSSGPYLPWPEFIGVKQQQIVVASQNTGGTIGMDGLLQWAQVTTPSGLLNQLLNMKGNTHSMLCEPDSCINSLIATRTGGYARVVKYYGNPGQTGETGISYNTWTQPKRTRNVWCVTDGPNGFYDGSTMTPVQLTSDLFNFIDQQVITALHDATDWQSKLNAALRRQQWDSYMTTKPWLNQIVKEYQGNHHYHLNQVANTTGNGPKNLHDAIALYELIYAAYSSSPLSYVSFSDTGILFNQELLFRCETDLASCIPAEFNGEFLVGVVNGVTVPEFKGIAPAYSELALDTRNDCPGEICST